MYLFLFFLLTINLFKFSLAAYFPLIGDEAYYWLWGQHLDLSYVDHPPLIAYLNYLLASVFGPSETAIRLAAILIVLLISWIIYLTGKELFDERTGIIAAVIFNLLPTFFGGGIFLVPQMLLFLFWALSFYLLAKIIKTGQASLWYLLGITTGLGLLSDYVMALFIIGTFIYLIVNKEARFWFSKKEPYLCLCLCLCLCLPVIIWNLKLGFTPLFYWGGKMGLTPRISDNLLNFFGLQMLLYTPPIFILTLWLIFRRGALPLLKTFSAMVFLPFLLISPIIGIGGHWPATAYLPAILSSGKAKKGIVLSMLFFALLVNGLGMAYYLFFYPTPQELKGKEFSLNAKLPAFLANSTPKRGKTFYFANDLGILGLVSFHGKVRTYMAKGRLRQVDLWGGPEIKKGDNLLYFALNEAQLFEKLKLVFDKVSIEPHKRLFTKDADLPNKTQIFLCEGFRGGLVP